MKQYCVLQLLKYDKETVLHLGLIFLDTKTTLKASIIELT